MAFVLHKPYFVADERLLVNIPYVRSGKVPARARPVAAHSFYAMHEAAHEQGVSLIVVSAFRSWEEQAACFKDAQKRHGRREAVRWVAPPGYSEHHTGYVFDIGDEKAPQTDDEPGFENTAAFDWLQKNAKRFSFELSFPPGNSGGVSYEPWHWRYVGAPEPDRLFHPGCFKSLFLHAQALVKAIAA